MAVPCDPHLRLICIPILLLTLGSPFAKTEQEVCCFGAYSLEPLVGELQDKELLKGTGSNFCCVACNLSYCCSSSEAQLNQQLCLDLQIATEDGQGKGFTQAPTTKPAVPNIGWFFIAVIIASGLAVCMYCCYFCFTWFWDWLLSRDALERPMEWDGVAPSGMTSLCQAVPPYVSVDPPTYSVEDPDDAHPVAPPPAPPAPIVRFQHLYSRNPEDEAVPYPSVTVSCETISDPSLVSILEVESSVSVGATPGDPL